MLRHAFAHPWLLVFLALLPALGLLGTWSRRRRRRALMRLGNVATLETLLAVRRRPRWVRGLCLLLGTVCLVGGAAGPQWGREPEQAVAPGRDLVVVLDCSRSMFAEAPSRLERARAALLDLAGAVQKRGGHRLALVLFAGRPRVACPLTHDYDHFRDVLDNIDLTTPDPGLEPEPGTRSGTRIGLALMEAVAAQDPRRFQGARDILLLSDGDDPARDGEWRQGVEAARAGGIPVIAVGVGDPEKSSIIRLDGEVLRHGGQEVRTRLEEGPLREIADRTHGVYVPAHTRTLPLGAQYLQRVARLAEREAGDDALPVYRRHPAWLLLPALVFLAGTMIISERSRRARRAEERLLAAPTFTLSEGNGS